MGVVKQKPFLTSTMYTMSITDIQCKTCVVCNISRFIILLFLYIILCVFIIYSCLFFLYVPAILEWTRPGKTGG